MFSMTDDEYTMKFRAWNVMTVLTRHSILLSMSDVAVDTIFDKAKNTHNTVNFINRIFFGSIFNN